MRDAAVPFVRTVPVASPAPGADWSLPCPGSATWRILGLRARLTTSAVAATRLPVLSWSDGTDDFSTVPPNNGITASKVGIISTFAGAPQFGAVDGPIIFASPRDGWLLQPGWSLRVNTTAIDVGDQWDKIRVVLVEYQTGAALRLTPDVYAFDEIA